MSPPKETRGAKLVQNWSAQVVGMAISEGDRHDAYRSRIQAPVLDVDRVAAMLRRRVNFIAAVTFACFGICLAWILLSPPKYIASGRVLLDLPVSESSAEAGNANAVGIENQIYVMTSRSVYDRVIAQENLDSDPLFGGRPRGIFSTLLSGVGLARSPDPHALALRQLGRSVSVTRNSGSSAVDVNVTTPDRETSARISNAVMDGYIAEQADMRRGVPSGAVESSNPRLQTLQSRLRNAEQRYEAFRAQNLKPDTGGQANKDKQVSDLSAQLSATEAKVNTLRSALAQLQRARKTLDGGGIPDMARSGAFGATGYRYADAKQLELDLSETLGPRHPDLIFARQRAAEARRAFDQSIGSRVQSTAANLDQARTSVTQLRSRLDASRQDLTVSSEAAARLKDLANDVEASRAAYQAVLTRSRDAGSLQQSGNSNARIISRATVPLEPSGSFPAGILLISLLLGLGLGTSLALLLELMDAQKEAVSAP